MKYPINRIIELRNKLESAGLKYKNIGSRNYNSIKRTEQCEEYVYEHLTCATIEKYTDYFYVYIFKLEYSKDDKWNFVLNKIEPGCSFYAFDKANDDNIDMLLGEQGEFIKELAAYKKKKSLDKDFTV